MWLYLLPSEDTIKTTKKILCVYFTPFPYRLYYTSMNNGNMAIHRIALGFVYCQHLFWASSLGIGLVMFQFYTTTYYYTNIICFIGFGYLFVKSIRKFNYLCKFV